MKLYIAGPMTGIPGHNYPEFRRVAAELEGKGYVVLNPANIDDLFADLDGQRTWQWYMRRALTMCVRADGVATLAGWKESRGASLEVHVARRLELAVRPWWEW
jgi:hypothetical protein